MMDALRDLADAPVRFDHVVVEASGVALPAAVAQSATLLAEYRLDAIVTLVDAETIVDLLARDYVADTVAAQLRAADLVVLNKIDLATSDILKTAREMIASVAPSGALLSFRNWVGWCDW